MEPLHGASPLVKIPFWTPFLVIAPVVTILFLADVAQRDTVFAWDTLEGSPFSWATGVPEADEEEEQSYEWESNLCTGTTTCAGQEVDEDDLENNNFVEDEMVQRGWRQFNWVYCHGRGKKGFVAMLLRKISDPKKPNTWIGIDNSRILHVLDLSKKRVYRARKRTGFTIDPFKQLSFLERNRALGEAKKMSLKLEGKSEASGGSAKAKEKAQTTTMERFDAVAPGLAVFSTLVGFGCVPAAAVLGWRVWVWSGASDVVATSYNTAMEVYGAAEEGADRTRQFWTWMKSLPWDLILCAFVFCSGLIVLLMRAYRLPQERGEVGRERDRSDSEASGGTENDSDEDEANKLLIKMVSDRKDEVKQMKSAPPARAPSPPQREAGPTSVQVADLLSRLSTCAAIADEDREPRGTAARRLSGGRKRDDTGETAYWQEKLNEVNSDLKGDVANRLGELSPNVGWKLPQGLAQRVAPGLCARVYKRGGCAVEYYLKWLTNKSLLKSSIASEVRLVARALDALVAEEGTINLFVLELLCRRLYSFEKAFEQVTEESHWRCPKGEAGKRWKSLVKWNMLDLYDIQSLERDNTALPGVDDEAAQLAEKANRYGAFVNRVTNLTTSTDGNAAAANPLQLSLSVVNDPTADGK